MRRVGEVVRTTAGLAIARSPGKDRPEIGETVLDEHLDAVGRVVDVIGPVSSPYLVVKPDGSPASLLGDRLYTR